MYAVLEDNKFIGFSLKEEQGYTNILISDEKHSELLECSGRSGVVALKNGELICTIRPSEYHEYNSETNEWIHDKELEINSLEEELGTLELNIFNKQNEIEVLKKAGKNFAAKKLEKEVAELEKLFEEKLARYEELEGE